MKVSERVGRGARGGGGEIAPAGLRSGARSRPESRQCRALTVKHQLSRHNVPCNGGVIDGASVM